MRGGEDKLEIRHQNIPLPTEGFTSLVPEYSTISGPSLVHCQATFLHIAGISHGERSWFKCLGPTLCEQYKLKVLTTQEEVSY